jgi:uncharacterized protein YdeI (YjbR/CyaY-like superfamily)
MKKSAKNPKVDTWLREAEQWRAEMEKLREVVLGCGLAEEIKWNKPGYTFEGKNVVVIQGFKAFCALLFFKGALLKDPDGILVKTGPNAHVGRQARFTSVGEIVGKQAALKACIHAAIEAEKAGLKVPDIKNTELKVPAELKNKLDEMPALKKAFTGLTPGRQRAYIFYISAAKQSQTRESRVEKCMPQILKGKGLNA